MALQITKRHLAFLEEAKQVFEGDIRRETHWNTDRDLIALRYGTDRDCISIFELGEQVAFFAQIIYKSSAVTNVREELRWFAGEMEKQLQANEHKGGWSQCSNDYLLSELYRNLKRIEQTGRSSEVQRRCANVANFALMLADKDRRRP